MILLIFSTIFSQTGFGENSISGNGFSRLLRSPCYNDFAINPASFREGIYSSFTPDFVISKSGQFEWFPSSFTLSIKLMRYLNLGLSSNMIFTKNFSYEFPEDSNEWDHYKQKVITKGSIFNPNGFLSLKINELQFGLSFGKIMGISKRIDIFDFNTYKDINDTSELKHYNGLYYSGGFIFNLDFAKLGLSVKKYNIDNENLFKIYYGFAMNIKEGVVYASIEGFNPSLGIVYKKLVLGGSFVKKDQRKEKIIGFGFSIPIRKNSIFFINNIRFIDGKLLDTQSSDVDYHLGITFEFVE